VGGRGLGVPAVAPLEGSREFRGTGRFEVRRQLGAGGFGVVYEAFDRERGATVALKTLHRLDPEALYRFKREFRVLADVAHPNLVALHELVGEGDLWFFTMELVAGVGFLEHVRPTPTLRPGDSGASFAEARTGVHAPASPTPSAITAVATPAAFAEGPATGAGGAPDPAAAPAPAPAAAAALDVDRLRGALRQLAAGVSALHARGILHRDLKPSNVLVTGDGRVVILDFGLALELGPQRPEAEAATGRAIVGTVAYMSPEQGATQPVSEASDWYSVGTLLYEALTGTVPFRGRFSDVIRLKRTCDPLPPRQLAPSCPADLEALCLELLSRRPAARPRGAEVLRRLGAAETEIRGLAAGGAAAAFSPASIPLVGRARHLAELARAFADVRTGRTVAVYIRGRSGMGKTALARRFVDELAERDAAVVLRGRCYERESVPFKALDSLVDALARHLLALPPGVVEVHLPRDIHVLARLFPALSRVEAVATAPARRAGTAADPHELRRRASAALRDLLGRMADRTPLVLLIDDLQWGDVDSATVLADILRPPDSPALLLVGCYRTEDADSPCVRAFREAGGAAGGAGGAGGAPPGVREIAVEPLAAAEAHDLAVALLGEGEAGARPAGGPALVDAVARECGGSPFFLGALVEHVRAGEGLGAAASLEAVLRARVARLPDEARRLLEVAAVAARPIAPDLALRAAGLSAAALGAVTVLRSSGLVRTRGAGAEERLETYHDRVRETVAGGLAAETARERHLGLALALEAAGERGEEAGRDQDAHADADADALVTHWLGAGERAKAAEYAEVAAARAAAALAFEQAARFCRLALELRPLEPEPARALRVRLGEALANAGRGAEAARAYLDAALGAPDAAFVREMRRRAAEQLLLSGRIVEGKATLDACLRSVGLRLPRTRAGAILSILARRAFLRLRGLRFRERAERDVAPDDLARLDVAWTAVSVLSHVDLMQASELHARQLLAALGIGEVTRIARALLAEVAYIAMPGTRSPRRRRRTEALRRLVTVLAERIGTRREIGRALFIDGVAEFFVASWRSSLERVLRCESLLREGCTDVAWELETLQGYVLGCLFYLGELRELGRRLPAVVADARERGDLYTEVYMRSLCGGVPFWVADEPDRALAELRDAIERWPRTEFLSQHWMNVCSQVQTELYRGPGPAAHRRLAAAMPEIERTFLLEVQYHLVETLRLQAGSALAAAAVLPPGGAERRTLLGEAERAARRLERQGSGWSEGSAHLVRAGVAVARAAPDAAVPHLEAAARTFDAADMTLFAAAARRRHGERIGGAAGRDLVAAADERFAAEGVRNPARFAAMLAPGFEDGRG